MNFIEEAVTWIIDARWGLLHSSLLTSAALARPGGLARITTDSTVCSDVACRNSIDEVWNFEEREKSDWSHREYWWN
jgi:hypothetical protein